ncbi:MAG: thiamine biosynthesis protein ApbE [Candidatus Aquicultor primus]|uniref:Thiamine biosynthesis protein ApbE n=1 Tax=Candidatus Aquicultor primus TaxID=1797195 RepID=A0A1F2UFS2_9ACTN|nr:MAG: thiamine biosynthesis protein ApbE [Candidatus Aquicultor primus]
MAAEGLVPFEVRVQETDLLICATDNLSAIAHELVIYYRALIEEFIERFPVFKTSFVPIEVPGNAPDIIKSMADAAKSAGVGPMAAVAGAISEYVGRALLEHADEVIVENGGDIFIKSNKDRKMGIYAGESPLSNRLAVAVKAVDTPLGICTSSGSVGHSTSFGKADAIVIFSADVALADAVATRVGNMVRTKEDIGKAIDFAQTVPGVEGVIIVIGDGLGGWGKFEFVPI